MDPALAAQMSGAVAEKVLRYRRDASGWKTCREGVSVGGRGGSWEFPLVLGSTRPAGSSSPGCFARSQPWRWMEETGGGGVGG